ncbi:hypothetical protein PPTG_17684 [Phytophthora nicotianae INRA-310]|uniref:Uncharacterized protein n=1 Tax=Phytophthora nicotianae (strain INRA-310) TaxID=761204 RepID=W2PKS5_PHYN3|nr:hypothetical protein PPTG_17684 [Phytophthora nicotianae INRA-310]ETN00829.1 hypothetical protein PPTG_17684 [Phytophthora nicotianae INRA-310]
MEDKKSTSRDVVFQVTTREKTDDEDREYIKVTLPRFSGGTAKDWLKWSHQFTRLCQLKKWQSDEKDLHLQLVLEDEALEAWITASDDLDMNSGTQFAKAYRRWGRMYVPRTYSEQLEEELFMFTKRRSETVSQCNQRMREIARMLHDLPTNPMVLDDKSMIRYSKRPIPKEWKRAYEYSGIAFSSMPQTVQYFERIEQSERRQGKEHGGGKQKTDKSGKQGGNSGKSGNSKGNNKNFKTPEKSSPDPNGKWCKLHNTSSHSDSECFTQKKYEQSGNQKSKLKKKTEAGKLTRVVEAEPDYSYSDDSEGKMITSLMKESSVSRQSDAATDEIVQDEGRRVALLDTGCGTSYINSKLLSANKKLGFQKTSSSMQFE